MNIKIKMIRLFVLLILISGCSLAPGMHMNKNKNWVDSKSYVYIDSLNKNIPVHNINEYLKNTDQYNHSYKIGVGDQIAVTVWGLPDIFPRVNVSPDQNLRRVDPNGNIFFPYAGLTMAEGKTQDELRRDLTNSLSSNFNDPQVDVTISRFNSQKIFVLGEVTKPSLINITDVPISLSDAISTSLGLNTNTSSSDVFIIRQSSFKNEDAFIFHANLQSPSAFIDTSKFYLMDNDIVYVNSSSTTRWNKVISQFFPFSTFLNSVDNLTQD